MDSLCRPTMAANTIRMRRLTSAAGSIRMVPMDHGISMGPLPGIAQPRPTLEAVAGHATCVTTHQGLVGATSPFARDVGVLMHLSGSTDLGPDPNDKRLVASVETAVKMGCDGVSTHLNLGSPTEARMLQDLGAVSAACRDWGMPHIAMVYPRGPKIDDPFRADLVAHAARLGAELGADAVKVPYTGDADSFRAVVDGAGVPVIIAGGPQQADVDDFLRAVQGAKDAGAAGVSVGRNVFQADDPGAVMQRIAAIFP